jgi:Tfp pilus assembly protein PilO
MSPQNITTLRERLASPLTWHYAGLAAMILVVVGLGARLGMDWSATNGRSSDALASKQFQLRSLEMQTAPLRGLDKRVAESRSQMQEFYARRIPANYSSIAKRIGELGVKSGVRLTGLQYTQGATVGDLTDISMDARISGEYSQIMRFINGLERDQTFFVIRTMALTGQQGGMVNLRLRVSTWLRPADVPSGLPPTPEEKPASAATADQEGE